MTKRGRPPREDGRAQHVTRYAGTDDERLFVEAMTTDERREAMIYWPAVARLVFAASQLVYNVPDFALADARPIWGNASTETARRARDELFQALNSFNDAKTLHDTV